MMAILSTLGNIRNFPRRVFEYLTVILNETRSIREELQQIDERAARKAEESVAMNAFWDEATQLLLQQRRQIETLLSANTLLLEQTQVTSQRLSAVEKVMKAQTTILPSWHATLEAAAEVRDVLRLLTPSAAVDSAKQRFGRDFDGGYIMLEDFKGAGVALSLGIKDDVSWDLDIARRGIEVLQFDHSIAAAPEIHERFHFNSLRIAAMPGDGAVTLEQAFRMAEALASSPVLLKMDIEGDEWDVLDNTSAETLGRCTQIVVEFHHMERLLKPQSLLQARRVFEKLTREFFPCHVHGNNCGNLVNIHNIAVPETLEVTFAKAVLYCPVETSEVFPQILDMPNQPGRADFFLGTFRF